MKALTFRDWWKANKRTWFYFQYRDYYPWHRRWTFDGFLRDIGYYWKCRLWKKYNTVQARTLHPTWTDPCNLLLHVMFEVLLFAVEKDGWLDRRAYTVEDGLDTREEWQEVAVLYDWWMNRRHARDKAVDDALTAWHDEFERLGGLQFEPSDNPNLNRMIFADGPEENRLKDIHVQLEQQAEAEDAAMMHRLVEIAPFLWT